MKKGGIVELSFSLRFFIFRDAVSTFNVFANSPRTRRFSTSVSTANAIKSYFASLIRKYFHDRAIQNMISNSVGQSFFLVSITLPLFNQLCQRLFFLVFQRLIFKWENCVKERAKPKWIYESLFFYRHFFWFVFN